jgi:hypothetical protein
MAEAAQEQNHVPSPSAIPLLTSAQATCSRRAALSITADSSAWGMPIAAALHGDTGRRRSLLAALRAGV